MVGRELSSLVVVLIVVLSVVYFVGVRPDTDFEIVRVDRVDDSVASDFDVASYLGVWDELARSPNRFQLGCVCSRAEYSVDQSFAWVNSDERPLVRVLNSCFLPGGFVDEALGSARLTDTPGLFEVQFVPWSSSEYRVLWVNDDYTLALVSSGLKFWILGREGYSEFDYEYALFLAEQRGFRVDNLVLSGDCEW